jgi:hypothetical protein
MYWHQIIKSIALSFFIIFFFIADSSFFPAMGGVFTVLNSSFVVSLFLVIIFQSRLALIFYLSTLLLKVLISGSMFFVPLIAGASVLFAIDLLLEKVFTNRSYYVLVALSVSGWVVYHLIYALILSVFRFLPTSFLYPQLIGSWWASWLMLTIGLFSAHTIGYLLINTMSKRFRSYFITTSR